MRESQNRSTNSVASGSRAVTYRAIRLRTFLFRHDTLAVQVGEYQGRSEVEILLAYLWFFRHRDLISSLEFMDR